MRKLDHPGRGWCQALHRARVREREGAEEEKRREKKEGKKGRARVKEEGKEGRKVWERKGNRVTERQRREL